MKRSQRAVILAGFFVLVLGIVLLIMLRPRLAVAPAPFATTPALTLAPSASGQVVSCGLVTAYASDGAQMRLTLDAGGVTTQYRLEYQFAAAPPPKDIGDRLGARTPQYLRVSGRPALSDSSSSAIALRDFIVMRVDACA